MVKNSKKNKKRESVFDYINGLLLLLVIILLYKVISGLIFILKIIREVGPVENWSIFISVLILLALSVFSYYRALILVPTKKKLFIKWAIFSFWFELLAFMMTYGILEIESSGSLVIHTVFNIIITAYLLNSKKVKKTFVKK